MIVIFFKNLDAHLHHSHINQLFNNSIYLLFLKKIQFELHYRNNTTIVQY